MPLPGLANDPNWALPKENPDGLVSVAVEPNISDGGCDAGVVEVFPKLNAVAALVDVCCMPAGLEAGVLLAEMIRRYYVRCELPNENDLGVFGCCASVFCAEGLKEKPFPPPNAA